MRYQGREVDPIALWSQYVDFPENMSLDESDEFSPLVQCPNPDHHTEKRHFQVNLDKPLVHCFANCGISGTYEHALAMITGGTHRAARKEIFRHSRIGVVKKKRRPTGARPAIPAAQLRYDTYLPSVALEYLAARGISGSAISTWEIGWDADSRRVVIPVKDARGRVKLLIKRAIRSKDWPKYLYWPEGVEKERELFGACQIDLGLVRSWGIVLVEGSIDTIRLHDLTNKPVGGILGSYMSEFQARIIANMRPKRVYTMFDADASGVTATNSVIRYLKTVPIYVCRFPKGITDPGEIQTTAQAERILRRAISKSQFLSMTRDIRSDRNPKEEFSFG